MRILISTFGPDDSDKLLRAMRSLSYDRLVLVGDTEVPGSDAFASVSKIEEMAGHSVDFEPVHQEDFMAMVDEVADAIIRHGGAGKDRIMLNISGGSKLLGDAALLAAFRVGTETYNIEERVTRLPILRNATARDRFTDSQVRMIETIGERDPELGDLVTSMGPMSRQSVERVVRELRKQEMLVSELREKKVHLSLSPTGLEVLRAIRLTTRASPGPLRPRRTAGRRYRYPQGLRRNPRSPE